MLQRGFAAIAAVLLLAGAQKAEAQDKLNAKLRKTVDAAGAKPSLVPERHRVIVSLRRDGLSSKAALRAVLGSTKAERKNYFDFVRSVEKDFTTSLEPDLAEKTIRAYGSIPALSMNLTAAEIESVAAHGLVERIELMEVYYKVDNESHPLTRVDLAQNAGFTGSGITVAVIDDGIQSDHPAFGGLTGFPTSKIVGGYDFGSNDSDPRNDCNGQSHGTNVAGMLVGDGGGITGVAKDARLVFLKIQSASICGQPALDGDLVGAVDWVVTNRDVYDISAISMSLGGGAFSNVSSCEASSTALTNALNAAEAAGIVNFAASGNDGLCSQMGRPACIDSVISVGAVYDADVGNSGFCVSGSACVSSLQTYPTCSTGYAAFEGSTFADKVTLYSNSTSFLDILAPSNCALSSDTGSGTNTCFGGTSAATPFAAGVGALAFEAAGGSRSLSRSAMENALKNNGVSVLDARMNRTTPRVDALATVQALNTGPAEICTNGVDDDGDGDTDCADSDCAGNAACQAPVLASYDFESGAQGWSNPDGNYGWRRDSNGTPSSSTGPTTGNGSTWYWYMETSNGQGPYNTGNADSTVVSPSIPNGTNRSLEFYYHMFGGDIGVLNAEVSTNGGSSWTTVWSIQGQQQSSQGAAYRRATADLSSFSGALLVRFRGEAVEPSVGWQNDIAIDDVTVYGNASNPGTPTELASYNFSSGTQGWSNPDGNYGWRRRSGSTPSNNTGPDNGQGNGGSYFYMETSNNQGPYDSGDPDAFLVSPTLPNGSNRSVEFYYHMYGSTMGRLNLEVSTNGGSSWTNVWSIQGQQHSSTSASYSTETVDLSGFSGSLRIRFRGESTAGSNGWRSDMAVDSITLFGN